MEKQKNIPALRFPEFSEEWVEKKLGDVGEIITGSTPPTNERGHYDGEYLFVSPFDIQDNRYVENTKTTLTKSGFLNGRKVKKGSSLFVCIGSTIGKVAQAKHDCTTNQQINSVISTSNNDDFVFSLLQFHSGRIQKLQAEQAVPILNKTTFSNYVLSIPTISEQNKIANFLTAIDEKLQALKKKKALLEQYKKGVMQKIFSQELRFKDENGNDFADWEKRKIGDIFKVTRGNVLSMTLVKSQKDEINKYPVYSSQTRNNGLSGYFDKFLFENAITWTTDGANAGDVNYRNGKFYCTNVCGVLVSSEGYANLCISEILNTVSNKYVSYVGNPKLMNNVMAGISIAIPSTIDEQQKIANFLTAIDEKINQQQSQIEKVSHYKKGLLQQMFC